MRILTEQEFWNRKVISKSGCWEWTQYTDPHGYGQLWFHGTLYRAHRLAYLLTHGKIGKGKLIAHRCDNPKCFNPTHLYEGTATDNARDANEHGKRKDKHIARVERERIANERRTYRTTRARRIRSFRDAGVPYSILSWLYGIDIAAVSRIVNRKTYRSV